MQGTARKKQFHSLSLSCFKGTCTPNTNQQAGWEIAKNKTNKIQAYSSLGSKKFEMTDMCS